MFQNVQFFSHLHLKYAKSAIMTQKKFFFKNINMGIKNAEFYADFKFVDDDLNNCPQKKLEPKNYANLSFFVFVHFFVVFCF